MSNFMKKIGLVMEVGGVLMLAGMAIKSDCERHKAKIQLLDQQILNHCHEINEILYESKIRNLEEELEALKGEKEEGGLKLSLLFIFA